VNQPFSLARLLFALPMLFVFVWAQRYWFLRAWRFASRIEYRGLRSIARAIIASAFAFGVLALAFNLFSSRRDLVWRFSGLMGFVGLWISTAFFAYLAVLVVAVAGWLARFVRAAISSSEAGIGESGSVSESLVSPERRSFVQGATAIAAAIPFGAGGYGFLIGRHSYHINSVSLPLSGLPQPLDGLRIVQLSDIHAGSYMSIPEVRRVVGMANELRPDLIVVTGDFITGANDPLEPCITELARLKAPLGVWGCNGNHEIYAEAEWLTPKLFRSYGMRLLRQENVELAWNGAGFNLIGVDYQRARDFDGNLLVMLDGIEPLIRRDIPNILLSHNPQSFPRSAELGVELMLAGHTHGGQVKVEILDRRFTPARLITPYVAGMYQRPLFAEADLDDRPAWIKGDVQRASVVYVNRGLGTIFAPVRLGVPPEISLLTLRKEKAFS